MKLFLHHDIGVFLIEIVLKQQLTPTIWISAYNCFKQQITPAIWIRAYTCFKQQLTHTYGLVLIIVSNGSLHPHMD